MTQTTRLNALQLVLLAGAAGRENGNLIPLPESCRLETTRIGKAISSLLRRGLIDEIAVTDRTFAWRSEDHDMVGLFITKSGRDAIEVGTEEPVGDEVAMDPATRPTSKIGTVLSLLQRDEGATLDEMVAATGWLPHTTRAALTGLRKKGHAIEKSTRETATCYSVAAEA